LTKKEYEINDHLGNVHVTFKDRKLSTGQANLVSYTNYYAYGTPLTGKTYSSITYSAGYNGKYKDDEVFGSTGTFYDYGERSLDLRGIPVFPSPDPLIIYQKMHHELSPYQYGSNRPIDGVDLDGLEYAQYNQLTNTEKTLLKSNPEIVPQLIENRAIAEDETKKSFGGNFRNDESDAFRHTLFNALNTQSFGADLAKKLGVLMKLLMIRKN